MDTNLKLEQYFFPYIQVAADPACKDTDTKEVNNVEYGIKVQLGNNKDENVYQITLEIMSFPEDEGVRQPYTIHLVVVGIFKVENISEPEKLLYINGSSILYSAAREFLLTTTGRGPWGALTLPTYSFLEHYKKTFPEKQSEKKTAKTSGKKSGKKKAEIKKGKP